MEARILLVDDHVVMRDALRRLLEHQPGLSVVGEATDGQEAVRVFEQLRPDLVVMDISLRRTSGLLATRAIHELDPAAKVLILSMHERGSFVEDALQAGALAYVVKTAPTQELLSAVEAALRGDVFLSPAIARHALSSNLARRGESQAALSLRERQILQGIVEGLGSKEIAEQLCLSPRTVGTHRSNLMKKLGLHKTSALVRYAIREGLVAP
jgi:two-component system response regulator NreC